jgi:uncharacterized protein (TIGR02996 family)
MTQDDAFIQAIADAHADDAPRLIYADWLDEHGQPERAEFIRGQCRLAAMRPRDKGYRPLAERIAVLAREHGRKWDRELRKLATQVSYHRGFADAATVPARKFLDNAQDLFRLAPIRHLQINHAKDLSAEVADSPHLRRVTSLCFRNNFRMTSSFWRFLKSPHLSHLTGLDLGGNKIGPGGLNALLQTDLPALTVLGLDGSRLGVSGLEELAASPLLGQLTSLSLSASHLALPGLQALVHSPRPGRLTALDLGGNRRLGDAGALCLARSPLAPRLTRLDLSNNSLTDASAQVLADGSFPRLTALTLFSSHITDTGFRALADSPGVAGLAALNLSINREVTDAGMQALLTSPHLLGLTSLQVAGYCPWVGAETRAALVRRFGRDITQYLKETEAQTFFARCRA